VKCRIGMRTLPGRHADGFTRRHGSDQQLSRPWPN
jgi:hypothetical protein